MIFGSKSTLSLNNLKTLRSKVIKNITNFRKKFCESSQGPLELTYADDHDNNELLFEIVDIGRLQTNWCKL
jgi:hypothetical protein